MPSIVPIAETIVATAETIGTIKEPIATTLEATVPKIAASERSELSATVEFAVDSPEIRSYYKFWPEYRKSLGKLLCVTLVVWTVVETTDAAIVDLSEMRSCYKNWTRTWTSLDFTLCDSSYWNRWWNRSRCWSRFSSVWRCCLRSILSLQEFFWNNGTYHSYVFVSEIFFKNLFAYLNKQERTKLSRLKLISLLLENKFKINWSSMNPSIFIPSALISIHQVINWINP